MKAKTAAEVKKFEDIPNIGPAMVRDFHSLGLTEPQELKKQDPFKLYQRMCQVSGMRQDPCVLDTYMAAVDFMNGAVAKSWWQYTTVRKKLYPDV
jgi:Pathogenicity locus